MDESAKGRYYTILGKYIWTELGLNSKLSACVIEAYYGTFKGYTEIKVGLGMYEFKNINTGEIKPK